MSIKYRVKTFFRHIANNTLGRLQRRSGEAKEDIIVFSTRRGGSTWLIELLSAEPHVKRAVEIFDVTLNHNPYKNRLPLSKGGFYIDLSYEQKALLFDYFNDLRLGKINYNTQWKFWQKPFNYSYNRMLFKVFYAKNYIVDFSMLKNTKIIFQVRHPIPTSLSICKQKWPNAADYFLKCENFKHQLSTKQLKLSNDVMENGAELEKYVLGWFLENWIPILESQKNNDWLILRYEDMVMNPELTISTLKKFLDLESAEAAREIYTKPSYNAFASKNKILNASPEYLCNGWKDKVDFEEHKMLIEIFNAFKNPYYSLD
ncbi:sulfotransferase domain-containing protein [Alteromonas flava]|uniref:sulfotransferase domain-containing protein n=1 Tax=Alteromonas flava TaxID=2048003 RepID=UPI000C281C65|nr:sulfotransferase domain-containing protein [Alteromonas flava]